MGQQRRKLLKNTGAMIFALVPGIQDIRREDEEVIKRGVYRSEKEGTISDSDIKDIQLRTARTYREHFGSNKPVGVGKVKPELDFPVYKLQYMIEPDGESHYWFAGKDTDRDLETTVDDTNPNTNVTSQLEFIGRYMQHLEANTEYSLPTDAELYLPNPYQYIETTVGNGFPSAESIARTATGPIRTFNLGTTQESVNIDYPVSQGLFTTVTKAGILHSISKIGQDHSAPDGTAHLVVQLIQIIPKSHEGWEIQSMETVHDWRNAHSEVVKTKYAPSGLTRGDKKRIPVDLGLSEPSASWLYSQPDITRIDLTESGPGPMWRWRWNRRNPGRNSVTLIVGSIAKTRQGIEKGDQIGAVRLGATFRQRGVPPVGECKRPWQKCVKPRFALESRYE